ncbi:MAG: metallophosphoesterase family protein [Acidobacteria bacterium]|nr:metallophosphoesterase family protein [Acidobacteriota bacterium]
MRYLVLSDIHANLEALDAVLEAAAPWDHALVLGDLVGYGADPNAVVERVRALPSSTVIRGNHDKVAAGIADVRAFNHLARQAIAWTSSQLTADNLRWLSDLATGPLDVGPLIEICHGTPFDEDVYVFDEYDATRALRSARRAVCLFGHTHVPAVFRFDPQRHAVDVAAARPGALTLDGESRYLVNVGSVGQPRDADPRAAFGIVDSSALTVTFVRAAYDIPTAQAKILQAGLPEMLAQRLGLGR